MCPTGALGGLSLIRKRKTALPPIGSWQPLSSADQESELLRAVIHVITGWGGKKVEARHATRDLLVTACTLAITSYVPIA